MTKSTWRGKTLVEVLQAVLTDVPSVVLDPSAAGKRRTSYLRWREDWAAEDIPRDNWAESSDSKLETCLRLVAVAPTALGELGMPRMQFAL